MSRTSSPPSKSWRWLVYFLVLVCLATAGVTLPIVYNLGQQLQPEQLEVAKERWQRNGPADYDLTYAITYDREKLAERHVVLVRGGRMVFASCEGEVVSLTPALSATIGLPLGGTAEGVPGDVAAIFDG